MEPSILERLHRERFLYLTTVGRKSGQPRTIEIWFVVYEGRLYVNAERGLRAHWVRNIQVNPAISVRVRGHEYRGRARILDSERDRLEWQAVANLSRQKYGWGEGLPVALDVLGQG